MTTIKRATPGANETAVKVAARLYQARSTLRSLWPDRYQTEIAAHQKLLHVALERRQCGALAALQYLLTELQTEAPCNSGITQLWLMAAYVEMIEPSFEPA
jgi:hypothetical protein